MTFLQPSLLWALPLVLVPVVIHLLNRMRYRSRRWAAMSFLLAASRQSQRQAKLRHLLLLLCRALVVGAPLGRAVNQGKGLRHRLVDGLCVFLFQKPAHGPDLMTQPRFPLLVHRCLALGHPHSFQCRECIRHRLHQILEFETSTRIPQLSKKSAARW